MFTIASAFSLLTPEPISRIKSNNWFADTHGGIKVYCTGNPL